MDDPGLYCCGCRLSRGRRFPADPDRFGGRTAQAIPRAGHPNRRREHAGRARGGTKDAAGSHVVTGIRKFCTWSASTGYYLLSRGQQALRFGPRGAASAAIAAPPAEPGIRGRTLGSARASPGSRDAIRHGRRTG